MFYKNSQRQTGEKLERNKVTQTIKRIESVHVL